MMYATAWQTVGPFLDIGLCWLATDDLTVDGMPGERITIEGVVIDGHAKPVADSMIEIWQANSHGRYAHPEDTRDLPLEPGFVGFGRAVTDEQGAYRFHTIKPGRVPGADGRMQAPHVLVSVFARGILRRLVTRIYFAAEAANAGDAVLAQVPTSRRSTLIANKAGSGIYRFNIVLQGAALGQGETVFFDI